jgi:hypothetical protein
LDSLLSRRAAARILSNGRLKDQALDKLTCPKTSPKDPGITNRTYKSRVNRLAFSFALQAVTQPKDTLASYSTAVTQGQICISNQRAETTIEEINGEYIGERAV